ncbi:MAG: 30S ribosomal protein S14 [Nanoarchaeota archaeon]|nr:30S ribosomal protein S14 [Nanoarchaeota archaeon]
MTTSDYRKVFKQLKTKPAKLSKYKKHNKPKDRATGIALNKCKRCGRQGGHISKYNLHLCRHCFREIAEKIGFERFS